LRAFLRFRDGTSPLLALGWQCQLGEIKLILDHVLK